MKNLTEKIEKMTAGHWALIYVIIFSALMLFSSCASVDPAKRYAKTHKDLHFKSHKVHVK